MPKRVMGFEGILLYGVAGSIPATPMGTRDMAYGFDPTLVDVSDRLVFQAMQDVSQLAVTVEFELNNEDSNVTTAALRAAASTGAAVALRSYDKVGGFGMLGDFVLSDRESQGLAAAQRLNITASPTNKEGRRLVFGFDGTLTTRNDDDDAVLTINGHPYQDGDTVTVSWAGGQRIGMTVSNSTANTFQVTGGAGDVLPAETTAIIA